MKKLKNITDGKSYIKGYLRSKRDTNRIPYCLMDDFITNEKHCQRCMHYCGPLTMQCGKPFLMLVK